MKRSKKIFTLFDPHYGVLHDGQQGHDEGAISTILKAIEIIRPDEFVAGGDFGEWESVSPWQYKRRARPPLQYTLDRLDVDLVEVNHQMDRIDVALDKVGCKKKVFLEGNHEVWVREMAEEMDVVAEKYDLNKQLRLRQRGYGKMVPYGQYIKRGKLRIYHGGHYTTVHHAFAHATKLGCSVMYGHTHDIQGVTVPSAEGPHGAYAMGCACALEKDFLKGRSTNWQHAFGVVYMRENGKFNVAQHRIEGGWCVVDGREIFNGKLLAGRPAKEVT